MRTDVRKITTSEFGPGLPTCAVQQVGSYLGYSGRGATAFGKAARDPKLTFRIDPLPPRTT
jgi:hypothetical protein